MHYSTFLHSALVIAKVGEVYAVPAAARYLRGVDAIPTVTGSNNSSFTTTVTSNTTATNDTKLSFDPSIIPVNLTSEYFALLKSSNFSLPLSEADQDAAFRFLTLADTPHHLESIDNINKLEFCTSWVVFEDRWSEGVWKRNRYLLGTNNAEFRLPYLGKKSWVMKYKWAEWLWVHRLNDAGKTHMLRLECTLSSAHNIQVYFHEDLKTWVIDVDERWGPVGDSLMLCMWRHMKWTWEQYTGCHNVGYVPEGYDGRA